MWYAGVVELLFEATATGRALAKGRSLSQFQETSFATGKITPDSDVDLFIIKRTTKPRGQRQREVSRLLIDREVPIDILVYTPAETERRRKLGDPFILDILNSGKLVYAKE